MQETVNDNSFSTTPYHHYNQALIQVIGISVAFLAVSVFVLIVRTTPYTKDIVSNSPGAICRSYLRALGDEEQEKALACWCCKPSEIVFFADDENDKNQTLAQIINNQIDFLDDIGGDPQISTELARIKIKNQFTGAALVSVSLLENTHMYHGDRQMIDENTPEIAQITFEVQNIGWRFGWRIARVVDKNY